MRYLDDSRHEALVDFSGTEKIVNTAMMMSEDPAEPGEWILVHMGIALHRIEAEEAAESVSFFDDMMSEFEAAAAARDARQTEGPAR